MSYPTIDPKEKQQIEEVFSLTGGELADKPLRYARLDLTLAPSLQRRWARYFYDGAPEYVERELNRRGGTYLTIVTCELYGKMPKWILTKDGRVWRKVRTFRSSGETECPFRDVEEDDVTWADHGVTPEQHDMRCPACEEEKGKEHGMIYIGDGWAEVVYRTRE